MKIGIVKTNQNNVNAWINIFDEIGINYEIIQSSEGLSDKDYFALVMPGVGSFDSAIDYLEHSNLLIPLKDWINDGKPLLAICLGFQILFEGSEEGEKSGLGFIKGICKRFEDKLIVPRMEWGTIDWVDEFRSSYEENNERYYFVHSFYAPDNKYEIARSYYGNDYCVGIKKNNVFGFQFHPEKSLNFGMKIIKNFIKEYA